MIADYLRFAGANARFVGFGFFVAFASSYGQTYFIGVFGPAIQTEFGLSNTAWGAIYMAGTLASAVLLPFTGKLIDRVDLRAYTAFVIMAFAAAAALMAGAGAAVVLATAIFGLRQCGQGLMSHTAVTSMTRYFDAARGRAVAIATLGFAFGEAVLPFAAVVLIGAIGWRASYGLIGVSLLIVVLPLSLWLLAGHAQRHREYRARMSAAGSDADAAARSWTTAQMLRDRRFYLLMPGLTGTSIIVTAMFFHHLALADAKGWGHAWFTGSYFAYAAAATGTSLLAGPLIDRYGAIRLVRYMLLPLVLALLVAGTWGSAFAAWLYLALMGANVGISHTAVSVMWAELYGLANLGAIKSLAGAISVFASALGPVTAGALMDASWSIERVCLAFAIYLVAGQALIMVALARAPRSRAGRHPN